MRWKTVRDGTYLCYNNENNENRFKLKVHSELPLPAQFHNLQRLAMRLIQRGKSRTTVGIFDISLKYELQKPRGILYQLLWEQCKIKVLMLLCIHH